MTRHLLAIAALFFCQFTFAETINNPFPAARFYPDVVGILYPGFAVAGGVNPATIPLAGKGTAIQTAVSPSLDKADPSQYFGAIATKRGSLGLGMGYLGNTGAGNNTGGAFVGMGYSFEPLTVGIAARDNNLNDKVGPTFDAGFTFEGKDFTIGSTFYHLNGAAQLAVGIGTRSGKRYTIEANLMLPPFGRNGDGYVG